MGWQWHQLNHMQIICTTLQTDNHARTPSLNFLRAGCPSRCPTNSVKALKMQWRLTGNQSCVDYQMAWIRVTLRELEGHFCCYDWQMQSFLWFMILYVGVPRWWHIPVSIDHCCFTLYSNILLTAVCWVVGCRRGYVSESRCRFAYGPADAPANHILRPTTIIGIIDIPGT